jgi:hypothetical protein
LPSEKGIALHLNDLEYPSLKDAFLSHLVKIGPKVLKKKAIVGKVYRQMTGNM